MNGIQGFTHTMRRASALLLAGLLLLASASCGRPAGGSQSGTQPASVAESSGSAASESSRPGSDSATAGSTSQVPSGSTGNPSTAATAETSAASSEAPRDPAAKGLEDRIGVTVLRDTHAYVVSEGQKRLESFTGSTLELPLIQGKDPAAVKRAQEAADAVMADVHALWKEIVTAKSEALGSDRSDMRILRSKIEVSELPELVSIGMEYWLGPFGSEWQEVRLRALYLDPYSGRELSLDEVLQIYGLSREQALEQINKGLDAEGYKALSAEELTSDRLVLLGGVFAQVLAYGPEQWEFPGPGMVRVGLHRAED